MRSSRLVILSGLLALLLNIQIFAQQNGSLTGQVVDSLGAIVIGASVSVSRPVPKKIATSNSSGQYTVNGWLRESIRSAFRLRNLLFTKIRGRIAPARRKSSS